jgi:hypothetical protein
LKQARLSNAKHELTGMLLYNGGAFVQILEGQPALVEAMFGAIVRDKRHSQITLITKQAIAERAYEGWTMSHKTLDPIEAGELIGEPGYFTPATWVTQLDSHRANKLLSAAGMRWKMEHRTGQYRTLGRSA